MTVLSTIHATTFTQHHNTTSHHITEATSPLYQPKPLEEIYQLLEEGNIQQHKDYLLSDQCLNDIQLHQRNLPQSNKDMDICYDRLAKNYLKLYQLVYKPSKEYKNKISIYTADCYWLAAAKKHEQNKILDAIKCMEKSIEIRKKINLSYTQNLYSLAESYLDLLSYYIQNKSNKEQIRTCIKNAWDIQATINDDYAKIIKTEIYCILGKEQESTFLQCNQVDSLHKALKFFNKTKKIAQKNLELYPFRIPTLYIEATTKIDHIYIAYLSHPENYQKSIKYPNKVYKLLKESMYFQENPMEVAIMFTQKGIRYYTLLESQNPKETYTYRKVIGNLNNALRYFDKAHDKKFDVVGHKKAMGTTLKDTWKIMPCKTCKLNNPTQKKRLCPCKKVVYCSKKCQKWHWKKQHRTECATYLQK